MSLAHKVDQKNSRINGLRKYLVLTRVDCELSKATRIYIYIYIYIYKVKGEVLL